jgi:hypothetical protein
LKKPAQKNEKERIQMKKGFFSWAFSGGLYFGKIPGSTLGTIGVGLLFALSHIDKEKPNAAWLFPMCAILGCCLIAVGYSQYRVTDTVEGEKDQIPMPLHDANGASALMMASQKGDAEVVKLLLDAKADVNVKAKKNGITPLFIASVNGYTEIVKLLLAAKADVKAKATKAGKEYTPLSIAKEKGYTEIIKLLEKAGAKE